MYKLLFEDKGTKLTQDNWGPLLILVRLHFCFIQPYVLILQEYFLNVLHISSLTYFFRAEEADVEAVSLVVGCGGQQTHQPHAI